MQMKRASIYIAAALAGWLNISSTNAAPESATPTVAASTDRKAILDVVRHEIKQLHDLQVVFVVRQLKIANNWAWLHALPQFRDGKNRHEDVVALPLPGNSLLSLVLPKAEALPDAKTA